MVLDTEGDAWLFGRNGFSALGVTGVDAVSENAPRRVKASELGGTEETKFVHAACGRNHTLLVGSEGQVWSAGANNVGQVSASHMSQRIQVDAAAFTSAGRLHVPKFRHSSW